MSGDFTVIMNEPIHPNEPDLIGYHLGILDASESAQVLQALQQSDVLRVRYEQLQLLLRPLEQLAVADPEPEYVESLMARMQTIPKLRLQPASRRSPSYAGLSVGESAPVREGPMISLKELVGLAAAVALFVALFVPGYRHAHATALQTACLDNFRALGMAEAAYAQTSGGILPFAGDSPAPWLSTPSGAQAVGNSRHVYLLLPLNHVDPSRFVCPARPGDRAMAKTRIPQLHDFPSTQNVSYSTQLLDSPMRMEKFDPAMPIMADPNPRFPDRRFRRRNESNSDSHGAALGQNVLRIDGHAAWTDHAQVGPGGDDIFKLADLSDYTGYERPQSSTDAFLVP